MKRSPRSPLGRKRIALLYCGGIQTGRRRGGSTFRSAAQVKTWLTTFPEMQFLADVEPVLIYDGPASSVSSKHWQRLAAEIHKRYAQYDGFVVTHGLSSITYSASAVAFMIQQLGKPIIFTGSLDTTDLPPGIDPKNSDIGSLGIRSNLLNAVQVATLDLSGTFVLFRTRLIPAVQALPSSEAGADLFIAKHDDYLGEVHFGVRMATPHPRRSYGRHAYAPDIDTAVDVIEFHPGLSAAQLQRTFAPSTHGVVVREHANTPIPPALLKGLAEANPHLPIVVQRDRGTGKLPATLIDGAGLTPVTAVVKLMWALGQGRSAQVKSLLRKNLAGEYGLAPKGRAS